MLCAYFDDSGTHDSSNAVIVAGLVGNKSQWVDFEGKWKKHIDSPIDGSKARVRRFHCYECDNALNEFAGWSRTESEYYKVQLANTIIDCGFHGYGVAVERSAWDKFIIKNWRGVLGDAEMFCIQNALLRGARKVKEYPQESAVEFIFDQRPGGIIRHMKMIARILDTDFKMRGQGASVPNISVGSSYKLLPLQAADLLANEFYKYACEAFEAGGEVPRSFIFDRMMQTERFECQIANRRAIRQIRESMSKSAAKKFKDHILYFGR